MELFRIILIFGIQLPIGVVYFLSIAGLILHRNRKKLNKIFSLFFISTSMGSVLNIVYSLISIEGLEFIVSFLHILAYIFFLLGFVFLLLFNLLILKSEKVFVPRKQIILLLAYIALFSVLFVIGLGFNGVSINPDTKWTPVWSLPFFITSLILIIPFLIVPIINYSSKILQDMQDKTVRQKWKIFMLGVVIYSLVLIGTALVNFLNISTIREVWGIFALILFLMVFTIYYGVGKKIK